MVGLVVVGAVAVGAWLVARPSKAALYQYRDTPRIFISGTKEGYGSGGVISQLTGSEPSITLSSYNLDGEVKIRVYRAQRDALFTYLLHDKENKQLKKKIDTSGMQFLTEMRKPIEKAGDSYPGTTVLLPDDSSGIYYLQFTAGDVDEDAFVVRSSIAAVAKEGAGEFMIWGQDTRTGRSLDGGAVSIWNLENQIQLISGRQMDQEGIATTPLTSESDIAVIDARGETAIIPLGMKYLNTGYDYSPFQADKRSAAYFMFTDRPLYMPGDTINVKAILREEDDVRYSIPSGRAQIKLIKDFNETEPILEKSVAISRNGTVDTKLAVPADIVPGSYQVKVSLPSSTVHDVWSNVAYAYIQIEHYRKPEYFIEASVPQTEYIAGDHIAVGIKGSYFFGQPLAGQTVAYTVTSSDYYDYSYYTEQRYGVSDEYRYSSYYGSKIAEGTTTLDERGNALIDIQSAKASTKPQIFSVEAQVDDGSGNPAFARKNILVYPADFSIYQTDYQYWSAVNEAVALPLIATRHQGTPVSGTKLTAKITRAWWEAYDVAGQKYPSYREHTDDVTSTSVTTDAAGKAVIRFTPKQTGSYRIAVSARDAKGREVSKEFHIWVSSYTEPWYANQGDNTLLVVADKATYEPDETANLTISSMVPDQDVLLTFERGRVNRHQIVHMQGRVTRVSVPLVSTDMPTMFARVTTFAAGDIHADEAKLLVSAESKRINVAITPQSATYAPGDTVRVNIATTDRAGNAVPAEVTLWSIDKAILELADETRGDVFDAFWYERYNQTNSTSSLDGIVVQSAERGGCFTGDMPVLMADGSTKPIKDIKVGDRVLTRTSLTNSELVSGRVTGTHGTEVAGYLIINGDLRVTPNHLLRVGNEWREAGSIQRGEMLVDQSGHGVPVRSIEWQLGKTQVYNLTIDQYHTFFVGGVWVHNDKGDGGSGAGRSTFKDTAYWNPAIQTDASGRAQVTFKLPDNLTTWVLNAVSVTADTRVGQSTKEIIATKPVISRLILPNAMRIGDEMILSGLVQNFTTTPHEFSVLLEVDGGNVEALGPSTMTIQPQGLAQLYWKVTPAQTGKDKATITLRSVATDQKDLADTVTQSIPLWAYGFHDKGSATGIDEHSYDVQLESDADMKASKLTVSLTPTILGTLPEAMDYLVYYPYGCVEQTTSRFVPAILAKENPELYADALKDRDVDDMIRVGISRLAELQEGDGGWGWWSQDSSDPYISSYVLEYLIRAQKLHFAIPSGVIDRAQVYVTQAFRPDTTPKLDTLQNDQLAFAILRNIKAGNRNMASNGGAILLARAKKQGDGLYWDAGDKKLFASVDASTALALRALTLSGADHETLGSIVRYLTRTRIHSYWSNTFATAQVVQALTDYAKVTDEFNPSYTYTVALDGKTIKQGTFANSHQSVRVTIDPAQLANRKGKLTVSKQGEGVLYSTYVFDQFRTGKNTKAQDHDMHLVREYVSQRGDNKIQVGDTVTVNLKVSGLANSEYYGVVDDELPAGLIPINEAFKNEQYDPNSQNQSSNWWDYTERVYGVNGVVLSPYRMLAGDSHTYTYRARAVSAGTFAVPPAHAELMYAPEVYARSAAQTVEIKPAGSYATAAGPLSNAVKGRFPLLFLIVLVVLLAIGGAVLWRKNHRSS